ncbi:MAG: hypothetical protein MMC23_000467 [Stictis urceolatum]|nr:hypothetical protein [Stictis urceolata]
MPRVLKRYAEAEASPSSPTQRRRSNSAAPDLPSDNNADGAFSDQDAGGSHEQMVKRLVRLALASEYSRQPLRRADISQKGTQTIQPSNSDSRQYHSPGSRKYELTRYPTVLHPNPHAFNAVFAAAQEALRSTFGMTLTELPLKEKHTLQQKRAAQRGNSQAHAAAAKAYILTSTLPSSFRKTPIMLPSRIPSVDLEAGYTGLYTFVVSVIMLSAGQRISDGKLMRLLSKVNADEMVLEGEKTEKVLKKMEREGYVVKIKEREVAGGEEIVEWVVGPRGKVEVGERGVAGLVKSVYGKGDQELEELEDRMERSLGKATFKRKTRRGGEERDGENGAEEEGEEEGEEAEEPQEEQGEQSTARVARPVVTYRGTTRPSNGNARQREGATTRRSTRHSNGFINDEADGEEDGEEEEEEEGEELEDDEEGDGQEEEEGEEEEESE